MIPILYEDENFLIANKPPGLVVHATLDKKRENLYDVLKSQTQNENLQILNRIDKDTSGIVLFSKRTSGNQEIQNLIETHQFVKKYYAIVLGDWCIDSKFECFLKKVKDKNKKEIMIDVSKGGVKSISLIKTLKSNAQYSLMEFTLITGRMHQIRVHAKMNLHPIAGDALYGDIEFNKKQKYQRMYLHSHFLAFEYEGKKIEVEAPLDGEWVKFSEQIF